MASEFKYWAFLSYSHQDNLETRRDGGAGHVRWAEWLHESLETYKVPRAFRKRETRTSEPMPRRFYPTFQDEKELPINADLGQAIRTALEQSRFLIVICSPRSATSRYVNEEVRYFKELGRQDRIITLIIDGEPNVSFGNKAGFSAAEECFCLALRHPLDSKNGIDTTSRDAQEPIAGDVRIKDSASNREALHRDVSDHRHVLDNMKLKLVAGMMGVGFDDLVGRDQQRQRGRRKIWISASTALVLTFATLAGVAFWQWQQAENRKQQALQTLSQSDFMQAQRLIADDKDYDALAYLERSLTNNPDNGAALTRLMTLLTYRSWFLPSLDIKQDGAISLTQLSQDGRLIRTVSGHTVHVWNTQTGQPSIQPIKPDDFVYYSQYSPDGTRLVTNSYDTTRVWNVQTGQPLTDPLQTVDGDWSAGFSTDGRQIFTTSADAARVWDAQTGKPLTEPVMLGHDVTGVGSTETDILMLGGTPAPQVSRDGRRIVTTRGETVLVWSLQGEALPELLKHNGAVMLAQFGPDGDYVATASRDDTARVWDTQTGELLLILKHGYAVLSARFSSDGSRIVTASGTNACVWDTNSGTPLAILHGHTNVVDSAQFSPDGSRIVTASYDGTVRVWDTQTGKQLLTLQHYLTNFALVASNKQTVTKLETFPDNAAFLSAQFSPDGRRIVAASLGGSVPVWDAQNGLPLPGPRTDENGAELTPIYSAQFSQDGKYIVTASGNSACIWEMPKGNRKFQFWHGDQVNSAEFSPDGKRVVTASSDQTARIWDAQTGQPLTEPLKHDGLVTSAHFSLDGRYIITVSTNIVRVWDAQTGEPLTEPLRSDAAVNSAEFSPDGRRIVTASADGTARVWDITPASTKFPNWLLPLTEVISGQVLDEQSVLQPTKLNRLPTINQIRQELNKPSHNDDWTIWGRWFLADPATRTISPFSQMTVPQYIEDLIQENTTNSLDEAESLALGNTNFLQQISAARQSLEQGTNSPVQH